QNSIDAGLTYAIAAGNDNSDVVTDGATPARVVAALTIGASTLSSGGTFIYSDLRASFSNFGNRVDLFAPGDLIRSASNTSDTASNPGSGTSEAAPHVAGAVAYTLKGELLHRVVIASRSIIARCRIICFQHRRTRS